MIKHLLMISALAVVPATGAMAQTSTNPSTTTPPAATTSPSTTTTTPGTTATPARDPAASTTTTTTTTRSPAGSTAAIDFVQQQSADQMMASRLIGMTVRGQGDENIGEVNDVVLSRDGKAEAVVIGVGGFLGIGEKDVAVPFESVQMTQDGNNGNWRLMVASNKDALKNAPEFKKMDNRTAAGSSATTGATGAGSPTGTGMGTTAPRTNTPQ